MEAQSLELGVVIRTHVYAHLVYVYTLLYVLGNRIDIKGLLTCNKCFLYFNKVGNAASAAGRRAGDVHCLHLKQSPLQH